MDPETFEEIVMKAIQGLITIFETFGYLLDGDFESLKKNLAENSTLFGSILAGIGIFFAGPIMKAINFFMSILLSFKIEKRLRIGQGIKMRS